MKYVIGPTFRKPFDSECQAVLDVNVCNTDAYEGDEVAFVDDELACPGCLEFAKEKNEDTNLDRASRIRFRGQS